MPIARAVDFLGGTGTIATIATIATWSVAPLRHRTAPGNADGDERSSFRGPMTDARSIQLQDRPA